MNANIKEWLEDYIYSQVTEEDYVDNLRMADITSPQEVYTFEEAERTGCCGSFDGEVEAPDGKIYRVGCNYGH